MLKSVSLTFLSMLIVFTSLKGDEQCNTQTFHAKFLSLDHQKNYLTRPYFELAAGEEIGVNQSYTTLGVITTIPTRIATTNSRLWLYTDSCWYHLIKGTNGASIEGGFVWGNERMAWGGYLGYDSRRWHQNSFNQVAWGLQMMCGCWQVFCNFYCPLQDERIICDTTFDYPGGFRARVKDFDSTYYLSSINITRAFNTCIPCVCGAFGIEPYYLNTKSKSLCGKSEQAWGGRFRLLLNISEIIKVEASVSHDKIFNSRAQVVLGIDLMQAYRCSCDPIFPLYKTFRRQGLVAIKHRESWEHNW